MVFATVIAVSADAYIAGISLCGKNVKERTLIYIAAYSFLLPALALAAVSAAGRSLDWLNTAGACIIIVLGLRGILASDRRDGALLPGPENAGLGYAEATVLGISLAADTTVGAAALFGEELAAAVPFVAFALHYILLSAGRRTSELLGASGIAARAASAAMVILGVFRLFG